MENDKARVIMLAASGVLLGATAFGWWLHSMPQQPAVTVAAAANATSATDAPTPMVTPTATTSMVGATREAGLDEAARSDAESRPLIATNPPEIYRATTREEAERAAHASVRQDPFTGITGGSYAHTAAAAPQVVPAPPRHVRHSDSNFVPPPPPEYTGGQQMNPNNDYINTPPPPVERRTELTNNDVRLVGVIDGKAIFRVNRDVASELGLPRAFTVGKGESFANIKVEKVDTDSATVRDGTSVATKELGPVQ